MAVSELRNYAGRGVGISRAWMGRLLGLGSGGERFAAAVVERHGVSALGDDAGKERHDEGVEHRADLRDVPAVHLRYLDHARRLVDSVHAFAQSSIGKYFVSFLVLAIVAVVWLILDRLEYLRSESQLESVVSRESSFLFNNLILLASCFAVLWGTLFPKISEYFTNNKISLDFDWYNRLMVPIGLFLLFLTGVGPLFAWRRTSLESLRRNFQIPGIAGLVLAIALFAAGMRSFYALGFVRFVPVRGVDGVLGVLQGLARHLRQERAEPATRRRGVDAPQYAPLRRLPGSYGHRADVHRIHRARVQSERRERAERRRFHANRRLRPEDGRFKAGRKRQLRVASRHHGGTRRANKSGRSSRRSASTKPAGKVLPK